MVYAGFVGNGVKLSSMWSVVRPPHVYPPIYYIYLSLNQYTSYALILWYIPNKIYRLGAGLVVSGCLELAKEQYCIHHDKMGIPIHWELCRKYDISCTEKQYNISQALSTEEGLIEIFLDHKLLVGKGIEHNKPDLVVVDKDS